MAFDLGKLLQAAAPFLGAALGGPVGGMAAGAAANALSGGNQQPLQHQQTPASSGSGSAPPPPTIASQFGLGNPNVAMSGQPSPGGFNAGADSFAPSQGQFGLGLPSNAALGAIGGGVAGDGAADGGGFLQNLFGGGNGMDTTLALASAASQLLGPGQGPAPPRHAARNFSAGPAFNPTATRLMGALRSRRR